MAKKEKYTLSITTYNSDGKSLSLSKKQYEEMIRSYKNIVAENNENHFEGEYRVEGYTNFYESEKVTEETYTFSDGATYIKLSHFVCKPGFVFR